MEKDIALIIIDMQVGVFDGLAVPAVSNADKLLSNISQLIEDARQAAIPIIFVQHNGEKGTHWNMEQMGGNCTQIWMLLI